MAGNSRNSCLSRTGGGLITSVQYKIRLEMPRRAHRFPPGFFSAQGRPTQNSVHEWRCARFFILFKLLQITSGQPHKSSAFCIMLRQEKK